jgi:hypothetical protein
MDIAEVRSQLHRTSVFTYTEKEVILYALGLGCVAQRYVFEGDEQFAALPSYVVVPAFGVLDTIPFKDYVPNFKKVREVLLSRLARGDELALCRPIFCMASTTLNF